MLSARLKQYYGRLRRPPGTHPLPGLPVIGHAAPATPSAGHRAGEGLSSSRRHHRYVPRPIRRGVLGRLHFQVFRAFRGLRPDGGGSALPDPTRRRATLTTPQASLHATDRILAPPITGLSTLGFDPTRFQTEPPVCYRASWQLPGPDFHRQATTSFTDTKIDYPELIATPPALLDALQILYRLFFRSSSNCSRVIPSTPEGRTDLSSGFLRVPAATVGPGRGGGMPGGVLEEGPTTAGRRRDRRWCIRLRAQRFCLRRRRYPRQESTGSRRGGPWAVRRCGFEAICVANDDSPICGFAELSEMAEALSHLCGGS